MNIHEYQAKKLLKKYKIKIPNGAIAYTPSEAVSRAQKISKTAVKTFQVFALFQTLKMSLRYPKK